MYYEEMQVTVDRAAALLPAPPRPGNLEGYARWEALTLDTGRLLARVLGADVSLLKALIDDEYLTPADCRQRRRLLLRVALLWACQTTQDKSWEPGTPYQKRPGNAAGRTVPLSSSARPIWLDAR